MESWKANVNSYIGNILVQESGQGSSDIVDDIFDATLMQAAGNRNKLDAERDRHREEEEELGGDVKALAMKLRQREGKMEPLRAGASSYIINITVQEAGKGGGSNFDDIFHVMLMQAVGNRNKLNAEREWHREEVEELGMGINLLATKLRQREKELELLRADTSSYIAIYWCRRQGRGAAAKSMTSSMQC